MLGRDFDDLKKKIRSIGNKFGSNPEYLFYITRLISILVLIKWSYTWEELKEQEWRKIFNYEHFKPRSIIRVESNRIKVYSIYSLKI